MTRFALGTNIANDDVTVDLPTLIDTRMLVQAQSGAGKSWMLRRLLEQTHGQVQQLVLDPEGEFATLREKYDYVIAGKGGDCAADPRSAKLLARRLLELGVSAVCDLYELKAHDRIRFVRVFLEALVDAPRTLRHPVLVVIDEAHLFAPEKGQAESAPAVIDLCTRGRKRGLCAVLATQRLSKLHKDAAAELRNVVIGATGLDIDQVRAGDVLGFGKAERLALRNLRPGEFWAYGPAISQGVIAVEVGPVSTTHPKVGARMEAPPPPTAKVRELLAKVADLPAEAEQEARDNETLRRELAEARRKLTLREKEMHEAVTRGIVCNHETEIVGLRAQIAQLQDESARGASVTAELRRQLAENYADLERYVKFANDVAAALAPLNASDGARASVAPRPKPAGNITVVSPRPVKQSRARQAEPRTSPNGHHPDIELDGPERRIINAIAWLESIGVENPEQPAVAFLAGYTYGGGAFNNPRGRLRGKGLVEYVGGERIRLTDAGRAAADPGDAPLTNDALHEAVLARLEGPHRRLLAPLLASYPEPMSNEALAEAAGYTPNAGAYNNPRGRLKSLGLIEYPQPGYVVARPLLFPEGA